MEAQPPPGNTGNSAGRRKPKPKRPSSSKTKVGKKRKLCEGGSCSLFLNELRKRFSNKKKDEGEASPTSIVGSIISSLTKALPVGFIKVDAEKKQSPMTMETFQELAPEMAPVENAEIPLPVTEEGVDGEEPKQQVSVKGSFKMPKMPLVNSDHFKLQIKRPATHDVAVNTTVDHNVASEIAKHVTTLRKISLIAEEFHQKTAKNLKEIVDSVQEDLMKKLEEAQAEQKAQEEQMLQQQQMMKLNEMQVE